MFKTPLQRNDFNTRINKTPVESGDIQNDCLSGTQIPVTGWWRPDIRSDNNSLYHNMWNDFVCDLLKKFLVAGVKNGESIFSDRQRWVVCPCSAWHDLAQEALWDWPYLFVQQAVMWRAAAQETDQECDWRSHLASSKDGRESLYCLLSRKKPQTINTEITAGPHSAGPLLPQ